MTCFFYAQAHIGRTVWRAGKKCIRLTAACSLFLPHKNFLLIRNCKNNYRNDKKAFEIDKSTKEKWRNNTKNIKITKIVLQNDKKYVNLIIQK